MICTCLEVVPVTARPEDKIPECRHCRARRLARKKLYECPFCGHQHELDDRYGCPNCHEEGLE